MRKNTNYKELDRSGGSIAYGNFYRKKNVKKVKTTKRLFAVLSKRFKPHYNFIILALKYPNIV